MTTTQAERQPASEPAVVEADRVQTKEKHFLSFIRAHTTELRRFVYLFSNEPAVSFDSAAAHGATADARAAMFNQMLSDVWKYNTPCQDLIKQ